MDIYGDEMHMTIGPCLDYLECDFPTLSTTHATGKDYDHTERLSWGSDIRSYVSAKAVYIAVHHEARLLFAARLTCCVLIALNRSLKDCMGRISEWSSTRKQLLDNLSGSQDWLSLRMVSWELRETRIRKISLRLKLNTRSTGRIAEG